MNIKSFLKLIPTVLACSLLGNAVQAQTNLSKLKEKKSKWRAIVEHKLDDIHGWDAGFATERAVKKGVPESYSIGGDTLMYNALLCGSGEAAACRVIPDSMESSGQVRRNPLLKGQPNTSNFGRLSKDHALAIFYWLSLPDNIVPRETKRQFAIKWQQTFTQPVTDAAECEKKETPFCLVNTATDPVDQMFENSGYNLSTYLGQGANLSFNVKLPPLSVESVKNTLEKVPQATSDALNNLKQKAKDSGLYDKFEKLLKGTLPDLNKIVTCLSSSQNAEICLKKEFADKENFVKSIIAATAICAEGAIDSIAVGNGTTGTPIDKVVAGAEASQAGRCVVSMVAAALSLPRVCDDINCIMSVNQMSYVNKVWEKLGLPQPFEQPVFELMDSTSEEFALTTLSFKNMNDSNLAALTILLRRQLGLKTSRITGHLTNRQPNNPFFLAMSKNPAFSSEGIAGMLTDQCASIESYRDGKPQYTIDSARFWEDENWQSFWRWKDEKQDQFKVDANSYARKMSMVWDCLYVANLLGVAEYPYLNVSPSLSVIVKVKKNESPTVYDTVAKVVSGGVPPLYFELNSAPATYSYFSFDPDTGIFIYRPTDAYSGGAITFTVRDAINRHFTSTANIAFDHSEIYPGHPPLTKNPERPLPAAINPLITVTNAVSNQVRNLDSTSVGPAELLVVTSGKLEIQAEAFIENVDENYTGNLDCTLDWTSKGGAPTLIKDNDDSPRNFFIQKSIDVTSLGSYEPTVIRMNCLAPDMPIIVKDIPVVYTPAAVALKKALDKAEYTYTNTKGGSLKLTQDKNSSDAFNVVYNYVLKSLACAQQTGTLVAATNVNKVTINGSFDGLLADGDAKKLVWLDVPVCGDSAPVVWKLQTASGSVSSSSGALCRYEHKKVTAGGKTGQITSLDGFGKSKSCDKNSDWKTSCKDGNSDTDEVGCEDGQLLPPPPPVTNAMCQYKHKKDTSGGKSGQVTSLDAAGKGRTCDRNGDWKTICKDGNGDTDEVGCEVPVSTPPPAMCQYKHKKDTTGGKSGQTNSLDGAGKSKSCDKNGDWKTVCKDGNGDTDEVACQ